MRPKTKTSESTTSDDGYRLNDLNSVLLEGEIYAISPALEPIEAARTIILKSSRKGTSETSNPVFAYVKADVSTLSHDRKVKLQIGRKIRIVGRITAPYRKGVTLTTEHIEFKPVFPGSTLQEAQ